MKELVNNWIRRAESDFKIGKDELDTEGPVTDAICFHMQQCAEKYLKAYLTHHNKYFRKTHDIDELIGLCKEIDKDFEALYQLNAGKLNRYAVDIRYPDDFYMPTIEEADECVKIATDVKNFVKAKLKKLDKPVNEGSRNENYSSNPGI